jgi:hypothetical protein
VRATPDQLLAELVGHWTRGEPLEVEELLQRAGPGADELASLIDAFLERAPRRAPTQDALAHVHALDQPPPPLLRARQARRLKLDDLAAALTQRLGLPDAACAKVRRRYQDLELGRLDPAGVAASVWAALAGLLGEDAPGLAASPAAGPLSDLAPLPAMYRKADFESTLDDRLVLPRSPTQADGPDEVDRLFGVTPEPGR